MTPGVHSHVDPGQRAALISTTFDHPVEVVWRLFSDPAKLARWWGPPGMAMTIDRHDLQPGGEVDLTVATPGGEIRGRWQIHDVTPPHGLRFTFSSDGLDPTEITVELEPLRDDRTTMRITARFLSDADLRHARDIGFVEGVARSCTTALDVVGAP